MRTMYATTESFDRALRERRDWVKTAPPAEGRQDPISGIADELTRLAAEMVESMRGMSDAALEVAHGPGVPVVGVFLLLRCYRRTRRNLAECANSLVQGEATLREIGAPPDKLEAYRRVMQIHAETVRAFEHGWDGAPRPSSDSSILHIGGLAVTALLVIGAFGGWTWGVAGGVAGLLLGIFAEVRDKL
jgi:hypothetical protein